MQFSMVLFLSGLSFMVYGQQPCNRRQCLMRGYYQEQAHSLGTVGVLYYTAAIRQHSQWRKVGRGQVVSAAFLSESRCDMVVRYANIYMRNGSTCQAQVRLNRGTFTRTVTNVHSCKERGSCRKWVGLDTLPSTLRRQCPSPSKVTVFIRPVMRRNGTVLDCRISATRYNRPIMRIFMEYSSSNGTSFTPCGIRITRGVSSTATASAQRDDNNRSIPSTPTVTVMKASQPSSFLSHGAIIGISVSVIVSGFLLAAIVLGRYRASRRLPEGKNSPNCTKAVQSNSGHPDGPVANTQEIAMYETVPNDASKRTKLSGATQGNNQSNVPMYESTAYVSITKKSCDLTESSAYGTNSDTN
eukprot:scpid57175/ scgid31655/ 